MRPEDTQIKITEKQQAKFVSSFHIFQGNEDIYFLSGNPHINKWFSDIILAGLGDLHYEIDHEGKQWKRHLKQHIYE